MDRKVKDFVRLALCAERRRVPLKRSDISEKVLMEHSRAFQLVYERAQMELREVFGMELIELPLRERAHKIGVSAARRATTHKEKTSSNTFILRSTLPAELRRASLIDWGGDTAFYGFVLTVLSLIYVHERRLTEDGHAHPQLQSLDETLHRMVKMGYLDKLVGPDAQADDAAAAEYRWGPRAKVEVGEAELTEFIEHIFGEHAPVGLAESIKRASGADTATE
ncbi:MAGE homology domain-containing protein [Syncephalis pseudoplumigaleata]|uniref:MAGE homology domain-containing protein n=1 Tax=Syncephalis pseudoplumigaleata TaxID=1712513 RepID=A0A4V1J225_9FUNG|nr:MAGE homology domain-containing protein [Syncephalis pseudoplumigaleata]|eukprot:RKP27079.1 MAGE homology domain-containing protein [Syncephalis pseudoplumigaleata]